jgi:hypothetical protein
LFGSFEDRHAVWQGLLDRGVLVRETGPDGWLRVSIGTADEMNAFKTGTAARTMEEQHEPHARIERRPRSPRSSSRSTSTARASPTSRPGVGFYDHMLNSFARHSLVDLTVHTEGDTHIDAHHTVEDTAIVLGQALREALGDKAGIRRFGDATGAARRGAGAGRVDVSGRPYCVHTGEPEGQSTCRSATTATSAR